MYNAYKIDTPFSIEELEWFIAYGDKKIEEKAWELTVAHPELNFNQAIRVSLRFIMFASVRNKAASQALEIKLAEAKQKD